MSIDEMSTIATAINPKIWALFLDIDGTLLEIASSPDLVVASPELLSTLQRLHHVFDGAIAIVTGREILDADRILTPLKMIAAGVHGVQLRRSFGGQITSSSPAIPRALLEKVIAVVPDFILSE